MSRIAALLLATALLAGACAREQSAAPTTPRGDPALRVAAAVLALGRGGEEPLSVEQARKILPLMKVLRDTSPEDRAASQALADEVLAILTPAQRAALERLREQAQDRAGQRGQPGGPPGSGPGDPGAGQGGAPPDPSRRAEFRRRAIDRAIRLLETKASS